MQLTLGPYVVQVWSRNTPESGPTEALVAHRVVSGSGLTAIERGRNNQNGLKDSRTENGSSRGQNLALTGLFVPNSLDCGIAMCPRYFCVGLEKRARLAKRSTALRERKRERAG